MFLNVLIDVSVISVLTAYLAYIWQNSKKTKMLVYYSVMHLLAILLVLFNFLTGIISEQNMKWAAIAVGYIIKPCFDVSFFFYGYSFYKKHLSRKEILALSAFPAASIAIILFNPYHRLFIEELSAQQINYGILYYAILIVGYCFQSIGAVYMMRTLLWSKKASISKVLTMAAMLLAFTVQFLCAEGMLYNPMHINPIVILAIFTLLFFSAYRMGFLNTLSLGVIRSLRMLKDAVLVFDEKGEEVFRNEACSMLGEDTVDYMAAQCGDVLEGFGKELKIEYKGKTLSLSLRPVRTVFKKVIGYVCIIHDDTDIVNVIKDLEEKNIQLVEMNESIRLLAAEIRRMAAIGERNALAKEIHDVLGHSLNLTYHILESNKIIIDKHPEKAIQRLKQAITDIDSGISEVEASSLGNEGNNRNSSDDFCKNLNNMAARLRDAEVSVEFAALDDLSGCSDAILQTIYRICQEASTNSIKHGSASQVIISIKRKEKSVILHIVDNGKGCSGFVKGNGLTGMEERVKKVGGNIIFGPFDDDIGFLVHAVLPLTASNK